MSSISANIKKLREKCRAGDSKVNFNSQIEMEEIETVEKGYGIVLSNSYKQFMKTFNGGMMLEHDIHFYTDMTDWEPDGPKQSSFYFFTIDEFADKYTEANDNDWLVEDGFKGIYPIIPICSSPKQELIFMVSEKGITNESPVFVCIGEISDCVCTKVAENFSSFLGDYIESDGFPSLASLDGYDSFEKFIGHNDVINIANEDESDEETIVRNTAYLRLYPKSSWTYNERGIAYRDSGQRKLALNDFNSSIELNNKKGFFYYCRGALILDYGSLRKALIDIDIAVKLEPESKLFLTGRADALQKLGKLEKALDDCNEVLNDDSNYILALYVRERVFKSMGDDELAQADADLIDSLS